MSEWKALRVSAGTQVVVTTEARGTNAMPVHPRGAVGIVARTPAGTEEHYPHPVSGWFRNVVHA